MGIQEVNKCPITKTYCVTGKFSAAALHFKEELVKRCLTFLIEFSKLTIREEAEHKSGCFSQEIPEHEVLVGKTEYLRTRGVRQEQVQFFALSLIFEDLGLPLPSVKRSNPSLSNAEPM